LRFTSLIIFLNNICPVGCETCNVSAKPDNNEEISDNDIDLILNEAKAHELTSYIIWTGGEPFYNPEKLKRAVLNAYKSGFVSEILTSAFYMPPNNFFNSIKGSLSVRISIDSEHQSVVKVEKLLKFSEIVINNGIDINFTVRKIPGNEFPVKDIFEKFKSSFPGYYKKRENDKRWIHNIPHIPLKENDPYILKSDNIGSETGGCKFVFRDLVAGWDGKIYPCCGLFSLTDFDKYSVIPIKVDMIEDLGQKMKENDIFKKVKLVPGLNACRKCHCYLQDNFG